MALKIDGFGRMLWRSEVANCGCYCVTTPTGGWTAHCCAACVQVGRRELALSGDELQGMLNLTGEPTSSTPATPRAQGPN